MDALVNMIIGSSEVVDVFVMVRLVVFLVVLEYFSLICSLLGGFKR